MERQVALGHAILIASMRSGGGGIKTGEMSTTRAKKYNDRQKSTLPPGVSYLCQRGKHKRCTRNNCTCDCGHPI